MPSRIRTAPLTTHTPRGGDNPTGRMQKLAALPDEHIDGLLAHLTERHRMAALLHATARLEDKTRPRDEDLQRAVMGPDEFDVAIGGINRALLERLHFAFRLRSKEL
jgi:hypothetical protein